jgi:hypothetical protein
MGADEEKEVTSTLFGRPTQKQWSELASCLAGSSEKRKYSTQL